MAMERASIVSDKSRCGIGQSWPRRPDTRSTGGCTNCWRKPILIGSAESRCRQFYHERLGRPSLPPGMYFRLMLIGFFEGIDSERGIAWRVADS